MKPTRTCMTAGNRRRLMTAFPDGSEMIEEFSMDINDPRLLLRKTKVKSVLGKETWILEVGDPNEQGQKTGGTEADGIKLNGTQPQLVRLDTKDQIQFRIRNLDWPLDNYILDVDEQTNNIVVKTKNKKQYKKIQIHEFDRLKIKVEKQNILQKHQHNTLIIDYPKPPKILDLEAELVKELKKQAKENNGDVNCKNN